MAAGAPSYAPLATIAPIMPTCPRKTTRLTVSVELASMRIAPASALLWPLSIVRSASSSDACASRAKIGMPPSMLDPAMVEYASPAPRMEALAPLAIV